jgi:glycosyltransferase involved in cell wall biosynthesis
MRILYFSFVELDIPNACRTHTLGVLQGFARQGCRVDALIPKPKKEVPEIPNVKLIYLRPWQFSPLGSLWIRLLSAILMIWLCAKNKYDFVYVRELEINPGPRWCSRLFNVPLYIEINDLLVPFFSNTGASTRWVAAIARHQNLDFRQAAGLIINSLAMQKWLMDYYGLKSTKFHHVFNGAELPERPPLIKEKARRRLQMPPNCFCLGFVGNLYDRYDFDTLLQACRLCRLKVPELYLLFIGDGPLKAALIQKTIEQGLENKVLFTGYVESESLGCCLPAIDVGLCLGDHYFIRMYGSITTKIATYGVYKIPVIVSAVSLNGHPQALQQSLLATPPEDAPALANLIARIYENRWELNRKAEIFHSFVKTEMTWDAVAKSILRFARSSEAPNSPKACNREDLR